MLMMILAATTAAAEPPPQKAQPSCPAGPVLVEYDVPTVAPFGWSEQAKAQAILVSKIVEPDKTRPEHELLPRTDTPSKGPAVLTPECKPEKARKKTIRWRSQTQRLAFNDFSRRGAEAAESNLYNRHPELVSG